ncbi:gliding motility-associated-like protein [Chitinophaga skermanii]|uniref:Gliding motility-associated-like protein n=1 Tax=Chitinophaga skermanii TaxID=331697 RepID=A0A327R2Y2_9BACT|nr:gliding motility-associated C-terminal domain-containing protein [Chitinophaga skermanii]RAJ11060.1 gliding motility-associated-like protein [Chitinophaga skermanii]
MHILIKRLVLAAGLFLSFGTVNAATIYVNLNATGTNNGSSWANAYTSLQTAIAAAAPGDQIWVAMGTYLPTTTSNTSIPFQMKSGVGIYGGFRGNEANLTDRNFLTNPTILSGDIGVPNAVGDNSISVVVFNETDPDAILDGFHVSGANGGATGGGIYITTNAPSPSNTMVFANVRNCTIENNTGSVNAGGIVISPRSVGAIVNAQLNNNVIRNNTGVNGAGVTVAAITNDNVINTNIANTVFYNNRGNNAGAIMVTNVSGINSIIQTNVLNVSASRNQSTVSSTGAFYMQSGTSTIFSTTIQNTIAYNNGNNTATGEINNTSGATISVSNSIISGPAVYPGTGNLLANPRFVNAATGNLDLLSCSPAINAGVANASVPATDVVNRGRTQFGVIDIGAFESPNPFALPSGPTLTNNPILLCQNTSPVSGPGSTGFIDELAGVGNDPTLQWYDASKNPITLTAPPQVTTVGQTTYFVTRTDASGCVSDYVEVTVNVRPMVPWGTTDLAENFCYGITGAAFTSVNPDPGHSILWYTSRTGPSSPTAPTIDTHAPGLTTYYVAQVNNSTGCVSNKVSVNVNIAPEIPVPTVTPVPDFCVGSSPRSLAPYVSGTDIYWIQGASVPTQTAPTVTPTAPTTTDVIWLVYQTRPLIPGDRTDTRVCQSAPAQVTYAIVDGLTPIPDQAVQSFCYGTAPQPIPQPAGNNYLWYTTPTGGTGSPTRLNTNTSTVGTYDVYVEVSSTANCQSNRARVPINILAAPAAPVVTTPGPTFCEGAPASPLTASSGPNTQLSWYTMPTGGAGVTSYTPVTGTPGNFNVYVSAIDLTFQCESPRVPAPYTVSANTMPDFTVSNICLNNTLTITLNGALPANATWELDGGQVVSGTGNTVRQIRWTAPGTYSVGIIDPSGGSCGTERLKDVTVNPLPTVRIAPVTAAICENSQVNLVASGAVSYDWTPKTGVIGSTTPTATVTMIDGAVYQVAGTDANGCVNTASITLASDPNCITYAFPNAFSPNGDGKNDVFRVRGIGKPQVFEMRIYNRWGNLLFMSQDMSRGWDGRNQGKMQPVGTYLVMIRYMDENGKIFEKKGSLTLVQ